MAALRCRLCTAGASTSSGFRHSNLSTVSCVVEKQVELIELLESMEFEPDGLAQAWVHV